MDSKEEVQNLSSELKIIFEEFQKVILKNCGEKAAESEQVYRFLKARDFDPIKAEKMLLNHLEWRQNMEDILQIFEVNKLQTKYFRVRLTSYTKDGDPFVYIDVGSVDFKGIFKSMRVVDFINGIVSDLFEIEKHFEMQSKKLGRRINQWVMVLDFGKAEITQAIHKPNAEFFVKIFSLYESNFPERLKYGFIINASIVFTIVFNLIKPILSANTMSKMKIFGTDGWKEEFLNLVHEDDLPVLIGGKKTGPDGDPYCNILKIDGPVPKECYFRSPERRLNGKIDVSEYILKRNQIRNIEFDVDEVKSEILWEFETETGDIAFGLFYRENTCGNIHKEIIPMKRVNSHMEIEQGNYLCDKKGTYILTLDNTHSWRREKQIFYKTYIRKPDGRRIFM